MGAVPFGLIARIPAFWGGPLGIMIIIHINRARMDELKSHAWPVPDPTPTFIGVHPKRSGDDFEFHVLEGEYGFCEPCDGDFHTVLVRTPADLETVKWALMRRAA